MSSWPSDNTDLMAFDFNRLTGDASVDYLRQATDAELKADAHPPPPDFMLTLSDFSERGHCVKAKPAF